MGLGWGQGCLLLLTGWFLAPERLWPVALRWQGADGRPGKGSQLPAHPPAGVCKGAGFPSAPGHSLPAFLPLQPCGCGSTGGIRTPVSGSPGREGAGSQRTPSAVPAAPSPRLGTHGGQPTRPVPRTLGSPSWDTPLPVPQLWKDRHPSPPVWHPRSLSLWFSTPPPSPRPSPFLTSPRGLYS